MALTKRIKAWDGKLTPGRQYPADEALKLVKEFAKAKFPLWVAEWGVRRPTVPAGNWAGRGWSVLPLRPDGKRPAFPDHPAEKCEHTDPRCRTGHTGWQARATTDPDRIRRAWTRLPYNIGLACGPARLVVVDLDTNPARGRAGGLGLAELADRRGVPVPATFTGWVSADWA